MHNDKDENVVLFETALDRAGFGCYSYTMTALTGTIILSFACVVYSTTIVIPASACELDTTSAQQGLMAAAPVIGSIIGTLVWGYLADTRGRRNMLMLSLLLGAVVNAVSSISVNWIMLMTLQLIAAVLVAGQFPVSMTLLSESVPMARRNLVLLLVSSIFFLAQGLMAVIAIPVIPLTFSYHLPSLGIYWNSWRTIMVIYSIPSVICVCWLFFMQESPKFVFLKESESRAIEILMSIHRVNNKRGEMFEVAGLIRPEEDQLAPVTAKEQIRPLFKMPLLKNVIILIALNVFQVTGAFKIWLPTIGNQFLNVIEKGEGADFTLCQAIGLNLDIPADPDVQPCALNKTALMVVLIVGVLLSLTNLVVSLVVNMVGRRNLVIIISLFSGLCGILVNLIPNAIASGTFFIIQLTGMITLGLYTAITVTIFPTNLRAIAAALTVTGSRIGSFVNIQILNFLLVNNCEVGFYLYSAIFASSALIASLLPDDRLILKPPAKNESFTRL